MKRLWPVLILCLAILCGGIDTAAQEDPWALEWASTRTASVRVYHAVANAPDPPQLRQLERAVQELAEVLGLDATKRASFRADPIEYLYLPDATSLQWFGVEGVDGLAFVAERRIIATELPLEHELVHVLAQEAIAPAPARNQPWIQEGLASYLGGHLGESPAAALALGDDALDRHPGLIPRILTTNGFHDSPLPAEEVYGAAARLVNYLDVEHGGIARILELMRMLAGFEEEVMRRPASFVEVQIEGVYELGFADLLERFHAWREAHPVAGVAPVAAPRRVADLVLSDTEHVVRWWKDESGWVVAATPLHAAIDLALVWGSRAPAAGAWAAPGGPSGYELRMDESGGKLLDRGARQVVLRWYAGSDERGEGQDQVWYFPAAALTSVRAPATPDAVTLWSQPRFLVD
jgi:hypothetical protein